MNSPAGVDKKRVTRGLPVNGTVSAAPGARECEPADCRAVADVVQSAFPDKFSVIFGSRIQQGARFMAGEFMRQREVAPVFVSEVDGEVVGAIELALSRESGMRAFRLFRALLREAGLFGSMRAAFVFKMVTSGMPGAPGSDSAYVEFIGVKPGYRGRGVGRALLEKAAVESRLAGKRRLLLEVAAENEEAKHLYRKLGFRPVKFYRSRLTGWLFGIKEWEVMELSLGGF